MSIVVRPGQQMTEALSQRNARDNERSTNWSKCPENNRQSARWRVSPIWRSTHINNSELPTSLITCSHEMTRWLKILNHALVMKHFIRSTFLLEGINCTTYDLVKNQFFVRFICQHPWRYLTLAENKSRERTDAKLKMSIRQNERTITKESLLRILKKLSQLVRYQRGT